MGKPFLTIQQQIELLESRGVKTDDASGSILLREGYYSVVNGYKDPFIDREATAAAGDDRYREGTTLTDIYDLFSFDRKLRGQAFRCLSAISMCRGRECLLRYLSNIGLFALTTSACIARELVEGR